MKPRKRKTVPLRAAALLLFAALVFAAPAGAGEAKPGDPPAWSTLVAGGDTVLARWEHDLVARHGAAWPLQEVAPLLAAADAALSNLECCVALGGRPARKGEPCSFFYRARPEMLACLTRSGIDIVTSANNHGGDYGPSSVAATARWIGAAGLVGLGIGRDPTEAATPRVVQVGGVRVAFTGLDTTMPFFRAGSGRPGTNFASEKGPSLADFTARMQRLGAWARGRCDLLCLTIHWGDNWVRETPAVHRKMARIAFQSGVDVILGHSAHRLQGIEVIDGKVAIYDMGNLLFDCKLNSEGRMSALFRLRLSPRGAHRVEILPLVALEGYTRLANPDEARETLAEMQALCRPLGTDVAVRMDASRRLVGVVDVPDPEVTTRPAVREDLEPLRLPRTREFEAPRSTAVLRDAVPEDAARAGCPVELAPGVELLGYRLARTAPAGGILRITTWWRVTRPVTKHWLVASKLVTSGKVFRRGTPWYTRHAPGDWVLPFARIRPGEIVEDAYPARLSGLPAGPCDVHVLVLDPARAEGERAVGKVQRLGTVELEPAASGG